MNQAQQQKPSPEDKVSVTKDKDAGACGLQRDLQDRLQPAHDEPVSEPVSDSAPHPEAPAGSGRWVRRLLKVGIGLAIVAVFGWLPLKAVLQTSSVEAVVNARIATLRSPIDGTREREAAARLDATQRGP